VAATPAEDRHRLPGRTERDMDLPVWKIETARTDGDFCEAAEVVPGRRREGELLKAETAMADGSKPMRWTYRRR
jgi:hypothetical protein